MIQWEDSFLEEALLEQIINDVKYTLLCLEKKSIDYYVACRMLGHIWFIC